jgi:hypothetical protein
MYLNLKKDIGESKSIQTRKKQKKKNAEYVTQAPGSPVTQYFYSAVI